MGCANQQSNILMAKSMKMLLKQTFFVFEPEQCLEMGNYKYSFDRSFIVFWQMELVCFCFVFFGSYILFILSSGCVTIANRELKSVSAI